KPCQDVPRYSGGETRVDDPLILLHRPDPTWRWRFWTRKRRSSWTSNESRALTARRVLGGMWRAGAPALHTQGRGLDEKTPPKRGFRRRSLRIQEAYPQSRLLALSRTRRPPKTSRS